MRALRAIAAILAAGAVPAQAAEPQIFSGNAWVCATPEAYDQAVGEAARTNDRDGLAKRLQEENLCIYIEAEDIEDIMPPFVEILDRQGGKAKVSFTIEHYRRIATLHRQFSLVRYIGWTDGGNLEAY